MALWRIVGSGLLLALALAANAEDLAGRVIAVADGDTLTLAVSGRGSVTVRLYGIDAPERNQPFSAPSRAALVALALAHEARVVVRELDRYGRTVGRVLVQQEGPNFAETDLSVQQLVAGWAVVYRQYAEEPDLLAAEADAQHERRGVWAGTCVKWSCGQMASCEEARDYLARCGVLRLDRDQDGGPCEALCR